MFSSRTHFYVRLLGIVFLTLTAIVADAADVSVRARLTRTISVIGDPVELQVKVSGARRISNPPDVTVDGLEIQYANRGDEAVVRMDNGSFISERTTTYSYQVVPQRNGSFTIPALTIEADGRSYNTQPIGLTVQPSSATDGNQDTEKTGFAELIVPKKTVYLGEAIPVEFRLYVDSRVRWQPVAMPDIGGEGFTKQKMPEPRSEQVERNGRDYDLLTFKTVLSPIRAGKLSIGPGEIQFIARVPHAQRSGGRNPFGDIFSDPFFSAQQQMKAKAPVVEVTVKPLPQDGKPADFAGAVGNFQFAAEGSPKQVKIGDPLTMKLRVSGRGNFDRVTAPVLADAAGWRTYPPSSTFQADDPVNVTGAKTFEMAVIPETKKTATPEFHFSYFDPIGEKYVTLKSEPTPLAVEGDTLPEPKPVVTTTPDSAAPQPKKPAAEPRPNDILGLRYEQDEVRGFAPLYERREFWFAQGGVAAFLLGFVALKIRRTPDAAVRQRVALRQEKEAVWRRLRTAELGHVDFFDSAARIAQIQTALVTGRPVGSIDALAVRAAAPLDADAAETIDTIFSARAELHYAGGGSGDGQVSATERERVLGALKQLEKGHAKSGA
ncbi:MAG: BatD family protein [Chthoniobacter sp.]|uniref:BatD family protein n=1 Tax=Chthoniobacter sp. TaxID=2510640 RepID=UPI0032A2EBA5